VVFGYYVKDPERYGIVEFDSNDNPTSIVEKPKKPKSNYAVIGVYFYDSNAPQIAKNIEPSWRNELEITDVNNEYLKRGKLKVIKLGRGFAWLDTGTYDSLIEASIFVKTLEERMGLKISCPEEIAYRKGFISKEQLKKLGNELSNTSYGKYLLNLI
ncbi:TPA: glucose-1-phosphate thymidylyltransferase, partial [Candidatus Aciduliprofundum boonei]|nr:glucose-1-phosphate thymidylyltransferase [Candidatus Aciduliprofundum boonei]